MAWARNSRNPLTQVVFAAQPPAALLQILAGISAGWERELELLLRRDVPGHLADRAGRRPGGREDDRGSPGNIAEITASELTAGDDRCHGPRGGPRRAASRRVSHHAGRPGAPCHRGGEDSEHELENVSHRMPSPFQLRLEGCHLPGPCPPPRSTRLREQLAGDGGCLAPGEQPAHGHRDQPHPGLEEGPRDVHSSRLYAQCIYCASTRRIGGCHSAGVRLLLDLWGECPHLRPDRVERNGYDARPWPCPCGQSAAVNSASSGLRMTGSPLRRAT